MFRCKRSQRKIFLFCVMSAVESRKPEETGGGSKNFEKGTEDNLSAPSSFIANEHNEIYAFYTEKSSFFEKI